MEYKMISQTDEADEIIKHFHQITNRQTTEGKMLVDYYNKYLKPKMNMVKS